MGKVTLNEEDREAVVMLKTLILNIEYGHINCLERSVENHDDDTRTMTWKIKGTPLPPQTMIDEMNRS